MPITHRSHPERPIRCLTIDVEEYFHIEAARRTVPPQARADWPSRVEPAMDKLLKILSAHDIRATLFCLADIARTHRALLKRCADAGHEIACHGLGHQRLDRLTPDQFRDLLTTAKHELEDCVGSPVRGFRAPSWSITTRNPWALDELLRAGFTYDASIFPVRHPAYGIPHAPNHPFLVQSAPDEPSILEIPPLTCRLAGQQLAAAGGAYFRILPLALIHRALKQAAADGRPAVLYFHPWEFDSDQPRMPLPLTGRLRTYTGIASAAKRLSRLLSRHPHWSPIADHLRHFQTLAQQHAPFSLTRPAS